MKPNLKLINFITIILIIILSSCSKNIKNIKNPEKLPPLEILYKEAFSSFEGGDWDTSIEKFKKIETRYSYSDWAPKASLMIIYMYYDSGESFKTLEYIKIGFCSEQKIFIPVPGNSREIPGNSRE